MIIAETHVVVFVGVQGSFILGEIAQRQSRQAVNLGYVGSTPTLSAKQCGRMQTG